MLFELSGCDQCALKQQWTWIKTPKMPTTLPTKYSDTKIVVLGEGPGESEDSQGKQFVGVTGQLLRKHIPEKWIEKLYWQNCVRCRPPNNRAPELPEIVCCSTYLEE